MTLIRVLRYAPEAANGLCASCTWGTVRKGSRENEAEAFAVSSAQTRVCVARSASAMTTVTAASR
jgi:hypothetical protein